MWQRQTKEDKDLDIPGSRCSIGKPNWERNSHGEGDFWIHLLLLIEIDPPLCGENMNSSSTVVISDGGMVSDSLQRDGASEHQLLLLPNPQEKGSHYWGSEDNHENLPALFVANTSPGEISPFFKGK